MMEKYPRQQAVIWAVEKLCITLTLTLYDYSTIIRQSSLQQTLMIYPPELLSIIGNANILDEEGCQIMKQLGQNNVSARSDGSVKDGAGGHSFCISDNFFTHKIWGHT